MAQQFQSEKWVPAPLEKVFRFFADPHNLPRIMPPGQATKLVRLNLVPPRLVPGAASTGLEQMAGTGTEMTVAFRPVPHIPMHERWILQIVDFQLNQSFGDTQKQGPFKRWHHTHSFESLVISGREGTMIRDFVEYEVGFGPVGRFLERALFQRMMRSTFNYRNRAIEAIFERK